MHRLLWLLPLFAACSSDDAQDPGVLGPNDTADGGTLLPDGGRAPAPPPDGAAPDGGVLPNDGPLQYAESPWGIAASASSSYGPNGWLPDIAATGIDWLRGFDSATADDKLGIAAANHVQVAGILYFSKQNPGSFPVNDLGEFAAYTNTLLDTCAGRVKNWEIWNEPPNFTEDKSPASYATIVKTAYDTIKAKDPSFQVGLAAQSVNIPFLTGALDAGAAGHFDYVTVHPYEVLDQVQRGWEAQFMSIVPLVHKMLADKDPAHANAPVWFTEMGTTVDDAHSADEQARTVVKSYTLGLASGVARMHWFEGKDGDSGPFGLIAGDGTKRPSYTAMTNLVAALGNRPAYDGWVLLEGQHYGFVFEEGGHTKVVAWAQPGTTATHAFASAVTVRDPQTSVDVAGTSVTLTPAPVIITGDLPELVAEARANRSKPLWWGGDFTAASSVTLTGDAAAGVHLLGTHPVVDVDGVKAFSIGDGPAAAFTVDPGFLLYEIRPIRITAVVKRKGAGGAGFNLKYEGKDGYQGGPAWFDVPEGDWTTKTYDLTDARFVGKWSYNFSFDSDSTEHSQYLIRSLTVEKL